VGNHRYAHYPLWDIHELGKASPFLESLLGCHNPLTVHEIRLPSGGDGVVVLACSVSAVAANVEFVIAKQCCVVCGWLAPTCEIHEGVR
jgi:hypothetical protein